MIRRFNTFKINMFRNYVTSTCAKDVSEFVTDDRLISFLSKKLNVPKERVKNIVLKNSSLLTVKKDNLEELFKLFKKYNVEYACLVKTPKILNVGPSGLERKIKVLEECGFQNISVLELSKFLYLTTRSPVRELKSSGHIPHHINLLDQLPKYLSMWPSSPPLPRFVEDCDATLLSVRMKILERYLELTINLQPDLFRRGISIYSRIRSRPLADINLTLNYLQNLVKMSDKVIRNNLFLLYVDPNKIIKLIREVKTLSGIDIEDVIIKKPAILINNIDTLLKIQKLLSDYNVPLHSQQRCMEIYTLSCDTVQERFLDIVRTPEYNVYLNNPRVLRLIIYKKKADRRLEYLKNMKKSCFSLNVLSSCNDHFKAFDHNPNGTKCFDFIQNISVGLGNKYSFSEIYNILKRHKFLNKVSITNVKLTHDKLSTKFSHDEIFSNCFILLYPWYRIEVYLYPLLQCTKMPNSSFKIPVTWKNNNIRFVDYQKLTNSQVLNLVLYWIEIEHHFSGHGIWEPSLSCKDKLDIKEIKSL